jgi:hypothetical protein
MMLLVAYDGASTSHDDAASGIGFRYHRLGLMLRHATTMLRPAREGATRRNQQWWRDIAGDLVNLFSDTTIE